MIISQIQIKNFKCFRETEFLQLKSGFNIVIGANNSGKSALMEALTLNFSQKPHRSRSAMPYRNSLLQASIINVTISLKVSDLEYYTQYKGYNTFKVNKFYKENTTITFDIEKINLDNDYFNFNYIVRSNFSFELTIEFLTLTSAGAESFYFDGAERRFFPGSGGGSTRAFDEIGSEVFKLNFYKFNAERLNIESSTIANDSTLLPNASNLPGVLNVLQSSNPTRFAKYIELVCRVFPDIHHITIPPKRENMNHCEIKVWNEPIGTERDDLAIGLSECGTGVSQVLAILYVLVMSEQPKVIAIDEPQSFLNPGAFRKLLEILAEYSQHQYILATHSPTLLSSVEIATLTLVRKVGVESQLVPLNPQIPSDLQLVFSEVGAQMSDVFGADRVLWVEGPTEKICFPLIARKFFGSLNGTVIQSVENTGDFEGKNDRKANMVFGVYGKLGLEKPLLPPAIAFVFDAEGRTEAQRNELFSRGNTIGVPVIFLKRRLYENYLLDPSTIVKVFNDSDNQERPVPLTEADVSAWIDNHRWEPVFFDNNAVSETNRSLEYWITKVHAAKILEAMFSELSEHRVEYHKTRHSIELTKWLLEHKPEALIEIKELLHPFLTQQ
jgi:predicted ATPase